jgi:hypothetical protein
MTTPRVLRPKRMFLLPCLGLLGIGAAILVFPQFVRNSQGIQILLAKPDPYGYPRPAPSENNVPVGTSFFLQLGFNNKDVKDTVLSDSISVRVGPRGGPPVEVLKSGRQFADGYWGKVFPSQGQGQTMAIYIDSKIDLKPSTTYAVSVSARSKNGAVLSDREGTWEFTTENQATEHSLQYELDMSESPVRWHGGFFTGFCKTGFCTSAKDRIPGYELMESVRKQYPKAWSLQRDFYLTGMERQPKLLSGGLPNLVRERETRRVIAMEKQDSGTLLRVIDFFGHEQYGIASGRRLSEDYHAGDEVLIADGVNDAKAKVLAVVEDGSATKSLLVTSFKTPAAGWKIEYAGPLPKKEDPNAPGLFPPGGCYLIKLRPTGTPHYYWGRLDKEWDIAHRRFNRRLVVNFGEALGDLSIDGRDWTFPKDYAEYHEVVRTITEHLLDRYGEACLDFYWSVFNEPDLATLFWRSGDWNEMQKSYDYTVDAILRAFENRGYDSKRVMVGGLEIGGIFGTNIEDPILGTFLRHCSPTATRKGAVPYNAAFADKRLDGKRSKRVEDLCRKYQGQGSPCDFLSVHTYNASRLTAAKLIRAKEIALGIDEAYYAGLWADSFESCPNWSPPPDVAAADSYLGDGYFPTWCADVARRLLAQAARDRRFSFGETILTFWSWPSNNFVGQNDATSLIRIDENGDGKTDRSEAVALPILNFLGLLSAMGDNYWILPEKIIGGHVLSGFISKTNDAARVLLYSHNEFDTQSRSKASFVVTLELGSLPWPKVRLREYAFDKDRNSYYRLAVQLRDRPAGEQKLRQPNAEEIQRVIVNMQNGHSLTQLSAIKEATSFRDIPDEVVSTAVALSNETNNPEVREASIGLVLLKQDRRPSYSIEEVGKVRELSALKITHESLLAADRNNRLRLTTTIGANGASIIVIEPAEIQ